MSLDPQFAEEPGVTARDAIIELIYAGTRLARNAVVSNGDSFIICPCGVATSQPTNPGNHHKLCPVARWYAAVERAGKI